MKQRVLVVDDEPPHSELRSQELTASDLVSEPERSLFALWSKHIWQ